MQFQEADYAESKLNQITCQYRQSSSATDAEKYIGLLMDSLETLPTDSGHAAATRHELDRTLPRGYVHIQSYLERCLMEFRNGGIDRNTLDRRLNAERVGQICDSSYLRWSLLELSELLK